MSKLRVCKLIRRHSFLDARVCQKQAKSLSALGYDVTVMAPLYDGSLRDVNRQPLPRSRYGSNRFELDGVQIFPYRARRIVPNARMMLEAIRSRHYRYAPDGLLAAALSEAADVYHAHEPETLYEAIQIKRKLAETGRAVKVVYDAHELEADTPLLKTLMREADHLITVSDSIAAVYAKRYPAIPISVIYNSPEWLPDEEAEGTSPSGNAPFTIGYEGMLTKEKGDPGRIKELMDLLTGEGIDCRFKVLGKVIMVKRNEQVYWDQFFRKDPRFQMSWVPFASLAKQWREVDAGYIYFDLSSPNRLYALPNKFFSLLNSGIPVVVNEAEAMAEIVRTHRCGIVLSSRKPSAQEYAEAYLQLIREPELLAEMGRNARNAMRTTYGWQVMASKLGQIYESLSK